MLRIRANQFRQRRRQPRNSNRELRPSAARAEDRAELRSCLARRQRSHQRASHPRALLLHRRRFRQEKLVPGKPGYVFSPFDKEGRYVDVSGFAPGTKVKDPWTDKIFLVP